MQQRDGVEILVDAFVEMEGVAELFASLEFGEGSLGSEDGTRSLQAEEVEKLLDEAQQKTTVRRREKSVESRVDRVRMRGRGIFEYLNRADEEGKRGGGEGGREREGREEGEGKRGRG